MTTMTVRHWGDGIRIQTRDAKILAHDTIIEDTGQRARDMMLTTNNRLTAEPNPEVPSGGMGVLYDGNGGIPKQADVELIFNSFVSGLGMLSPGELSKLKAVMMKYAGAPASRTNQAGMTSSDSVRDSVRRGVDAITSINDKNKAFWDKQLEADNKAIFGR